MNDLISRQAAIEALDKIESEVADGYGYQYEKWRKYFCGLPSAQPQWIPCSERLPEEDFWSGRGRQFSDHVLVTIVNHANDDESFTDMAQTVDGIWQLSHDVYGDCSLPNWCEVIAWMPLPPSFKEE